MIMTKTKNRRLRFYFAALAIMTTAASAVAQGSGVAGITEATQMVTSYFDPATKLIYAVGAVVGLIGGVKVYSKFSSGDPDTSKTAASWFGACIFLIVAATILRSFFL
jgi:ABC-type sugar transport system substrate-binding protein